MHVVEAVFAKNRNKHSTSHDDRLSSLKAFSEYRPIHKKFRTLYNLSLSARYIDGVDFDKQMPASDVEQKVLRSLLRPVEENSIQFLSKDAQELLSRIPSN